jgi:hypothetical protein
LTATDADLLHSLALAVPTRDRQSDVVAVVEGIPAVTSLIDKAVERMDRLSDDINYVTTHSEKQARLAHKMFDMAEGSRPISTRPDRDFDQLNRVSVALSLRFSH